MNPRQPSDSPWCWQAKSALQKIMEATSETSDAACRTRSVYVALTELASDEGAPSFTVTKALIAYRSGTSIRTVQRVLPLLQSSGLLQIEHSKGIRAASRYTLLGVAKTDMPSGPPFGHGGSTFGHDGSTTGHGGSTFGQISGRGQLADKVEEKERTQKEPNKEPNTPLAKASKVVAPANSFEDTSSSITGDTTLATSSKSPTGTLRVQAEEIYTAYPRRAAKKPALKAIEKVLKSGVMQADALLNTTKAYAAAVSPCPADRLQYIPYPATWFNRGSYDDDPAEWTRFFTGNSPTHPKPIRQEGPSIVV